MAMHIIEVGGHDGWEDVYYDESSTITLCNAFECVAPTVYDSSWCRAHEDPTSGREACDCRGCKV